MKSYPIIQYSIYKRDLGIRSLPFDFVSLYRKRIETNHGQTLERLAERGGLCWYEVLCGINDEKLSVGSIPEEKECCKKVLQSFISWLDSQA